MTTDRAVASYQRLVSALIESLDLFLIDDLDSLHFRINFRLLAADLRAQSGQPKNPELIERRLLEFQDMVRSHVRDGGTVEQIKSALRIRAALRRTD